MAIRPKRILLGALIVFAAAFLLIQLVPYGRDHSNPAVVQDAPWPDERSEELARAACYDCHSNETEWPFYTHIAPMSWLVTRDVEDGRDELNFSDWGEDGDEAEDAAETVLDGSMPPSRYEPLHPDAELSDQERSHLAAALIGMDEDDDD